MLRSLLRRTAILLLALLAVALVVRALLGRRRPVERPPIDWPPIDVVPPPSPWVEPDGATCPASHPLKAKLSSGIYHSPGGLNYDRTNPDRCYADTQAAEFDGLRASKR